MHMFGEDPHGEWIGLLGKILTGKPWFFPWHIEETVRKAMVFPMEYGKIYTGNHRFFP